MAAACLAALDVLETEPQWMERLWDNTRFFKAGLQRSASTPAAAKARSRRSSSARRTAAKMSDRLFERGVFAQGIGFPTVARGKARLRTIVTATHTRDDLQFALDMFGKVGKGTGVI